jgi:multiple sugar transport system permease protein
MQRKSTIAFLMALPLILLILILVAYPAGYASTWRCSTSR